MQIDPVFIQLSSFFAWVLVEMSQANKHVGYLGFGAVTVPHTLSLPPLSSLVTHLSTHNSCRELLRDTK